MAENRSTTSDAASIDLLVHPVRLRIVAEFCGRELTTRQLADGLADVPQATLYRQIRTLLDAGVLEVTAEVTRGGAVERTYRLVDSAGRVSPEEASSLSSAQHGEYFSLFTASLVEAVATLLRSHGVEYAVAAGLTYNRLVVHLNAEEHARFREEFGELVERMLGLPPGPSRARYTLATVVVPHVGTGS